MSNNGLESVIMFTGRDGVGVILFLDIEIQMIFADLSLVIVVIFLGFLPSACFEVFIFSPSSVDFTVEEDKFKRMTERPKILVRKGILLRDEDELGMDGEGNAFKDGTVLNALQTNVKNPKSIDT